MPTVRGCARNSNIGPKVNSLFWAGSVVGAGDSISRAMWGGQMNPGVDPTVPSPGYGAQVAAIHGYSPVWFQSDVAGERSDQALTRMPSILSDNPLPEIITLAWGTNDCVVFGTGGVSNFIDNMIDMVDLVLAAGKIPAIPTVPYSTTQGSNMTAYRDAIVNSLWTIPGVVHGADLYDYFEDHTDQLQVDGIHPTVAGFVAAIGVWVAALADFYD